ncbi:CBS domain-containing protein [Bacillus sp. JJ1609]|uniref:CBS domain-containing protein n=1 Tax=Bacillus sp. JJ1609 TaxID=3122977 RepID=UPI002FFFD978
MNEFPSMVVEQNSHVELSERFEVAFNQIHAVLKRLNPNENVDAFVKLLSDTRKKHASIESFYYELKQFAKLRNALVHEKLNMHTYIATPSEETVLQIERIASSLSNPPLVLNIATSAVVTIDFHATLEHVIHVMKTSSYSQFPVYNQGRFQFLLTEKGLTNWISSNIKDGMIRLTGIKANNLAVFEDEHNVKFINRKMDIFELEEIFEEAFQKKQRLEAVIVTETGSPVETPLGIITPWDLIEIDIISPGVLIK